MNNKISLLNLVWRSFFLQGLWNFEGLQNAGFLYTLYPTLRKLYPDPEKRKEALLRHLDFFNTQPYMASLVIGLVAKLEEEKSLGKEISPENIASIKKTLAGPLAAMGDALFWATFRPLAAVLTTGLIFLVLGHVLGLSPVLVPVFFFVFYNSVQLVFRYWGTAVSYALGEKTIEKVVSMNFQKTANSLHIATGIALLLLIIYYFAAYSFNSELFFMCAGVFAVSAAWALMRWPVFALFYLIIIFGVGFSILF